MGVIILQNTENTTKKTVGTRQRNINLAFRVTEEEKAMIDKRVSQSDMSNLRAYMVKMAIDGRVIRVELDSVREMVRLLSNVTNNINQITRALHQSGNIYAEDVEILRDKFEDIWEQTKVILQKLSQL